MRILGRSLCELRSSNIEAFILLWMHRVPRCRRKTLSYNGVLLAKPGDPVHYQCPYTQAKYFDPGNVVYGLVVDVVCPEGCKEWTDETKGDIIESILGLHYERCVMHAFTDANFGRLHDCNEDLIWFNELLNSFTHEVYKLWCEFPRDSVQIFWQS